MYPSLQFLVLGAMAVSAGAISYLLPETVRRPMPETLSDLDSDTQVKVREVTTLSEDKVKLLEGDILQKEKEVDDNKEEIEISTDNEV